MGNFSFSSSLKLTAFDLRRNRRQIFGWCAAIFAVMFMYMILFPSMQDVARMKMEAMPEQFMEFFGMGEMSELSNFTGYFGMVFNLILIAVSIFAATFSANLIYREEKNKTIEFLYSLEVSRAEIYVSKLLTAFSACLAVLLSAAVSTVICGYINGGDSFVLADALQIVKVSGFSVFVFMAVSIMLAGMTAKVGPAGLGSMAVLITYMLGYLSKLLDTKAQWLAWFSPLEKFSPQNALDLDGSTMTGLAVYFGLFAAFLIAGGAVYRRRDFNI